jgi:NADPH-dependent ferric siderophore reductase
MPDETPTVLPPPPRDWTLQIAELLDINKAVRRVRLAGEGLATLEYVPGQDMAISVEKPAGTMVRRRYTICALDRVAELVDIEVVTHDDGPGALWARNAPVGQAVEVVAPRGKIFLAGDVRRHIFLGDDAAVPAAMAMMDALPPGSAAQALLEVGDADEERDLVAPPGVELTTSWLHRDGREPGSPELLTEAAESVEAAGVREATAQYYVFGEFGVVRTLRARFEDLGVDPARLSTKAYWRRGLDNAPHGEPVKD